MVTRVLHFSDIHFCTDETAAKLQAFQKAVMDLDLPIDLELDIEIAETKVVEGLAKLVNATDPDAIVVTGDLTTFGDAGSFEMARSWLAPLAGRPEGKPNRSIIVTPGNHDVLEGQFASLYSHLKRLGWLARTAVWWKGRHLTSALRQLLPDDGDTPIDIFAGFETLRGQLSVANPARIEIDGDSELQIFAFNSVSSDPLWTNLGAQRLEEVQRMASSLASTPSSGALRIAALHHNPASSAGTIESTFVNAYNSMPGGPAFLQRMQQAGIDIVLHGHQHVASLWQFDYELKEQGHAYCIGIPSSGATTHYRRGLDTGTTVVRPGCNLLEVADVNHVRVIRYEYDGVDTFNTKEATDLPLERNRPVSLKTQTARLEIKKYLYHDDEASEETLWNELLQPGAHTYFISGRHLKTIRERKLDMIKSLLAPPNSHRVRMLVSSPSVLRSLSSNGTASVWGSEEDVDDLAKSAERTLSRLKRFCDDLSEEARRSFEIRESHTLLPFGAVVRDATKPWGKMMVKVIPVGAVGSIESPFLRLNRRHDSALYMYYLEHLKKLLASASLVAGDWSHGDEDLRI